MKNTAKTIAMLLVLACLTLACAGLAACSKQHKMVVETGESGVTYVDQTTKIGYKYMGMDFEPLAIGEVYASLWMGNGNISLYKIEGLAPEDWLATGDRDVFRRTDISVPEFSLLEPTAAVIRTESSMVRDVGKIESAEECVRLRDLFLTSPTVELVEPAGKRYDIYFTYPELPGLCYHLICFVLDEAVPATDENGDAFSASCLLYSLGTKQYRAVAENLMDKYLDHEN